MDSASSNGDFDNTKAAPAILQYLNTPIAEIELSPVQNLFHCQLLDDLPANTVHYHLHSFFIFLIVIHYMQD